MTEDIKDNKSPEEIERENIENYENMFFVLSKIPPKILLNICKQLPGNARGQTNEQLHQFWTAVGRDEQIRVLTDLFTCGFHLRDKNEQIILIGNIINEMFKHRKGYEVND